LKASDRSLFRRWLSQAAPDPRAAGPATDSRLPVLVVGAGPAGLAGMAALREAGIEFQGVESHANVGGIWDIANPISSVYEGMRTVTSRYTTHLGPPVPKDWPNYLPHTQAHEYLSRFAESEDLLPRIEFHTRFVDGRKTERGTWHVTLSRTDREESSGREFRGIVFATGAHHRELGAIPQPLGEEARDAGIEVLHSSAYKRPEAFAGQRVLVIGVGNSGSDIADKISQFTKRTLLAIRTTPWINPQTAFGIPCDKLTADTPHWFPRWYKLSSFHVIRWLSVGGFRRLGLRAPRHSLNDRLPIGDRGIVAAIRSGRVTVRSHVTSLAGGVAHFADPGQAAEPVDAVIFSTGFDRRYPLLSPEPALGNEMSDALSFLVFHRHEPGLAYLAEAIGFRGCWPVFADQARAVAAYFAADARGGTGARQFDARRGLPSPGFKGELFAKADGFHVDYDIYSKALGDLADWLAS
jgi:cation diffusion facilitator CzcD-associated flavoprotein CzcO